MKTLFIIYLLVILTSCRSLYISDLKPEGKISTQLPQLAPHINVSSLENVFGINHSTTQSFGTTNIFLGNITFTATSATSNYRDPSIQDISVIFDRDVKNNICDISRDLKGYITCNITTGYTKVGGAGWTILSVWGTAFIGNLFGMPILRVKSGMEVEVQIFDSNKKLLGSYTSPYYQYKVPVALYHGYNVRNGKRKTAIMAFKSAMSDIKRQIQEDSFRLNSLLK